MNLLVDTAADLKTVRDFWNKHQPGVPFIMKDAEEGVMLVVDTDSDL